MTPVLRYDINKITVSRSAICSHSLSFDAQRPVSRLKEPNIRRVCSDLYSAVHLHLSVLASPAFFRMLSGSSSAAIFLMLRQSIGHAAWRSTVSGKTAIQTVWRKHRSGSGKASALRTASENAAPTAQAISPARARSRAGRKDTRELFAAEFSGRVRGCQRFNAFDRV